jgi:hypothetical protein
MKAKNIMKRQILFIECIILTAAMSLLYSSGLLAQIENDSACTKQRSIIFISDTQSPMWFEKLFVKTHRNEEATQVLFSAIAHDSTVSSVFFLGDITAMSSYDFHWEAIDTFLLHLKARQISSYATTGNHDYLLTSASGEANVEQRFPDFQRTGYTIRLGSFAMVLLNSNFGDMEDSEKVKQHQWYRHELQTLDQDSTIMLTAVGCHHSPYSNSSIVGFSQQVRDEFVPPFMESNKCRLFISGHAHTFQHFKDTVANKHFLVIGGGGGLLHTLITGKTDELQDQVKWTSEYRMFHFVRGVFTNNGLLLNVMMLTEDLAGPESVYKVFIPFPH